MNYFWFCCLYLVPLQFCFSQEITISGDTNLCLGQSLVLEAHGDTVFAWANSTNPENILSTEKIFYTSIPESSTYLLYTSADTLSTYITVTDNGCDCQYYVPNHFTPDGDQWNEKFFPVINCDIIGLRTTIYHRNQQVIFDSNDLNARWDGNHEQTGEPLADGIYIYQISFMKSNNEVIHLVGFIHLLR